MSRVVLVGSSEHLPGLFPFQSWEALREADLVWARDPGSHPSAPYLELAEIPLVRLEPVDLDLAGLDLSRPGSVEGRRYAKALLDLAEVEGRAVYLLGPDDGDDLIRSVGMDATDADRSVEVEFVFHLSPPGTEMLRLAAVERRLRDPEDGCPWDLEQDHGTLGRHLVEETYELLDAIDRGDDAEMAEELGDVLLQVIFHAQIAADRGAFDIDDVASGIADKLVHRHPHVFADVDVADADEVKTNWEELKQEEKQRTGPFDGVPAALPALQFAAKLQKRAARSGFDWRGPDEPAERVRQELDEVDLAGDPAQREEEIGDLLGAVVGLARHLDVDPETAMRRAATKFRRRFEAVLESARERGLDREDLDRDVWLGLWEDVKREEPDPGSAPQ